jgi:ElaB/YqjD/DUF883 family membrane-anchored ribosome-binding protein
VTAPGIQQNLVLVVLALVALHAAYIIGAASSSKQHDVEVAALKAQHEQQLQQLGTEHTEQLQQLQQPIHCPTFLEEGQQAMQDVPAARQNAAAPTREVAAEANSQRKAVTKCDETAAITNLRVAFTDQRLLAASKPGSMDIVELRQIKKCNPCLKGVPTQSNQHVKRTREAVHAALQIRLEQWLEENLLLAA